MRYECTEDGFAGAFVEFTTAGWTRKDLRELRLLDEGDAWFALLQRKVTAVSLPVLSGEPIVKPSGLTPEALDRLDLVLYHWLTAQIVRALREVTELGNAVWRRQFASAVANDSTESTPTQS